MKNFLASAALLCAAVSMMSAQGLVNKQGASGADTLILSRSVYAGNSGTVSVGQTLPPSCVAGTVKVPTLPLSAGGTTKATVTCATAGYDGTYPLPAEVATAAKELGDHLATMGAWIASALVRLGDLDFEYLPPDPTEA